MTRDHRAQQVGQLIHRLSELPGSAMFSLVAKRYPRLGPAEDGHVYEEKVLTIPAHGEHGAQLSADSMAVEADDLTLTLEGALPTNGNKAEMLLQVSQLLGQDGVGQGWDYRLSVHRSQAQQYVKYHLRVFVDPMTEQPEKAWPPLVH